MSGALTGSAGSSWETGDFLVLPRFLLVFVQQKNCLVGDFCCFGFNFNCVVFLVLCLCIFCLVGGLACFLLIRTSIRTIRSNSDSAPNSCLVL